MSLRKSREFEAAGTKFASVSTRLYTATLCLSFAGLDTRRFSASCDVSLSRFLLRTGAGGSTFAIRGRGERRGAPGGGGAGAGCAG